MSGPKLDDVSFANRVADAVGARIGGLPQPMPAPQPAINPAALGSTPVECVHGYDVCPICDVPQVQIQVVSQPANCTFHLPGATVCPAHPPTASSPAPAPHRVLPPAPFVDPNRTFTEDQTRFLLAFVTPTIQMKTGGMNAPECLFAVSGPLCWSTFRMHEVRRSMIDLVFYDGPDGARTKGAWFLTTMGHAYAQRLSGPTGEAGPKLGDPQFPPPPDRSKLQIRCFIELGKLLSGVCLEEIIVTGVVTENEYSVTFRGETVSCTNSGLPVDLDEIAETLAAALSRTVCDA